MAVSDNVAVVALIVSLVALLVTTVQLLQQLTYTADGYRRCSPTVIGPWASLRRRRLLPLELRVETEYFTPEISVVTHEKLLELKKQGLDPCIITRMPAPRGVFKEVQHTVHGIRTLPGYAARNSHMVTWLALVQEVHVLYSDHWPGECHYCKGSREQGPPLSFSEPSKALLPHMTNAAVVYRQWTWDLMPADMPRPPAVTTIGDLMILATRLGMRWRLLDFASGRIHADGNGYNLTTVEGRGLGLVVSFSRPAVVPARHAFIPSKAVDKMICGILPGCPVLVKRDYELIGDDRRVSGHKLLATIGVIYDIRAAKRVLGGYEPYAEACMLLMPFLPLDGCPAVDCIVPAWTWRHDAGSILHFWEGRMALFHGFSAWYEREQPSGVLKEAHDHFSDLRHNYEAEFIARRDSIVRTSSGRTGSVFSISLLDFMQRLRSIFDFTTQYFDSRGFSTPEMSGQTGYERLVAMHVVLSAEATEKAMKKVQDLQFSKLTSSREAYPWLRDIEHEAWLPQAYEVERAYCEAVEDEQYVARLLVRQPALPGMTYAAFVEAWWILMLRGVVWQLSVLQESHSENVPAWCYENKTPVWIM